MNDFRVGQGYDVHRFEDVERADAFVMLCGVRVPHSRGVLAHSDGDIPLHALCDALLGAVGLGDIGRHFPDTDARWKGADSRALLRQVSGMLSERGWRVGNVDITIIAQAPKVSPHVAQMCDCIAADLAIGLDRVSVKATTTEKLGFTGRGEGIAACAVALVSRG